MNICDRNHDEIVFEGKHCPLCETLEELENLENQLGDARETISGLENELKDQNEK